MSAQNLLKLEKLNNLKEFCDKNINDEGSSSSSILGRYIMFNVSMSIK